MVNTEPDKSPLAKHAEEILVPESALALMLLTVLTVPTFFGYPFTVVGAVYLISLALHVGTVKSGSHFALWSATLIFFVPTLLCFELFWPRHFLFGIGCASLLGFAYNELLRLVFNRRRNASIDTKIFAASGISFALVAFLTITIISLNQLLSNGFSNNWLWMPLGVLVLSVAVFLLIWLPARWGQKTEEARWQPGARIPPAPNYVENKNSF